jgi:hypothetical protein
VDQGFVFDGDAMLSQGGDAAFQVHGVPENEGTPQETERHDAKAKLVDLSLSI